MARWSSPASKDLERIFTRIQTRIQRDNPMAAREVAQTIYLWLRQAQ